MFNEIYSDTWLKEKDVNADLITKNSGIVNPIVAIKILNAVKKIVGIVHGNNKYEVMFNGQEESAYIDYSKKIIVLTSTLLKNNNKNYSLYDIIDIEAGLALHESGHAEYTPNPLQKENEQLYKRINSNIKHNIHNIIEDAVMEAIVSNDFPGYAAYFIKLRNHYFQNPSIEKCENENINRINEFLIGLRYTKKAELNDPLAIKAVELVKKFLLLPNEELKKLDRVELTQQVYDLIIIENNNKNNNNKNNNNNFGNSSCDSSGNSSNNSDDSNSNNIELGDDEDYCEVVYDLSNDEISGELKELIKKQFLEQNSKLDKNETTLIDSMLDEGFEENELETSNNKKYTVITCKPKVIPNDISKYNKSLQNMRRLIFKFRNKFSDANTIYKQNSYGLSRGNLDEDSLYSAKYNRNIFMNNTVNMTSRTKNIDIAFTIDCSGSMFACIDQNSARKRYEATRDLAVLFTEALAPINSINTWVFGFQESYDYISNQLIRKNSSVMIKDLPDEERYKLHDSTHLIQLYSPNMKTKYAIGSLSYGGFTPEYEGLTETINILQRQGKKENKKIIVMLTDGSPHSSLFTERYQKQLLTKKIQECKKKDITIIHLALTTEAEFTPYENKVKWDSQKGYDGLVDGFTKMLQKLIS